MNRHTLRSASSCASWRLALGAGATLLLLAFRAAPVASSARPIDALREASEAYAQATAAGSADAVVAFFDPDVIVMSPQGRGPVRGIEPNRAAWARFFGGVNPKHTMTTDSVVVSSGGDMGYTTGEWTAGMDTPAGRVEAAGSYIAVWRLKGDAWKAVAMSAYPFR